MSIVWILPVAAHIGCSPINFKFYKVDWFGQPKPSTFVEIHAVYMHPVIYYKIAKTRKPSKYKTKTW